MKLKKKRIKNALAKAIRPGQNTFDDMILPESHDELMAASFAFCDMAIEALIRETIKKEGKYPSKVDRLRKKIEIYTKLLTSLNIHMLERTKQIDEWRDLISRASRYNSI